MKKISIIIALIIALLPFLGFPIRFEEWFSSFGALFIIFAIYSISKPKERIEEQIVNENVSESKEQALFQIHENKRIRTPKTKKSINDLAINDMDRNEA